MNSLHRSPVLTTFAPNQIRTQSYNAAQASPSQLNSNTYPSKLQEKSQSRKDIFKNEESISSSNSTRNQQDTSARKISSQNENQENIDPSKVQKLGLQDSCAYALESQDKDVKENQEQRPALTTTSKSKSRRAKKFCIGEFLYVSKPQVDFGTHSPGQIWEESLEITNKSHYNLLVQIEVDCLNSELQEIDEYVYSIRRSYDQDYNDRHFIIMTPLSTASFKLALNVPLVRLSENVLGEARIFVQGLAGMYRVGLSSSITTPKVICPRELYHVESKCNLVKLCVKRGKKQETKIPLKNASKVPVVLELEFYTPKHIAAKERKYCCIVYPNVITLLPEATGFVTLYVKNLVSEKDESNKEVQEQAIETIKDVLVGRVVNSAVFYSFALSIELY